MSKFMGTPGPWFISGNMTLYIEARISGGLLQEVAAVGPTEADGGYGEQQRANARLIAAAPELLEALQYAMETLKDCDMDLFHNVIEVGDAATAKALGNQ